jgi:uncharacterized HhH-GPD family protein
MPKIERLEWLAPLSEGRGITLSNDPEADLYLAADPNALLLGVLLDSQYATRMAFASPYRLYQRLGHLDLPTLVAMSSDDLVAVFREKPALHRFPAKFATLTAQLASHVVDRYDGDASRLWTQSSDVHDLSARIIALPAFGVEKTNWTVGMLGTLGLLPFEGWRDYRAPPPRKRTGMQ